MNEQQAQPVETPRERYRREDREDQQREDRRLGEQMEKIARWERDHERGTDA